MYQPSTLAPSSDTPAGPSSLLERCRQWLDFEHAGMMKFRGPREGWKYSSYPELVYDVGTSFEHIEPLENEAAIPKACYDNALSWCLLNPGYFYVEGYAITDDIPLALNHGWIMDSGGRAFDVTWDVPSAGIGVVVYPWWALKEMSAVGCCLISEDWRRNATLLRSGFPDEALWRANGPA